MTLIDSLLSFLRDRREIEKNQRQRISEFLRKIAECCSSFSKSCIKLSSTKVRTVWEKEAHNLHYQVNLVENYLEQLDTVLKGKVESETLDELAITLSRISTAEVTVVNFAHTHKFFVEDMHHKAIQARFEKSWEQQPVYHVTFLFPPDFPPGSRPPQVSIHEAGYLDNYDHVFKARMSKDKSTVTHKFPTVNEFLSQLAALHAKIVVLADAIEAGANL
jgi:hypothetical protein